MAKTFQCSDIGVACSWHTCADTEQEVMEQVTAHARDAHGMTELTDEMRDKIHGAVKEGPCPVGAH